MLQKNPLQPPRPAGQTVPSVSRGFRAALPFVSAEDFDQTGILMGVDPCESRYWWIPELYGPESSTGLPPSGGQATRRPAIRPTTAA